MRLRGSGRWSLVLTPSVLVLVLAAGCAAPGSSAVSAPLGSSSASAMGTGASSPAFAQLPSVATGTGTSDETSTAAALPDCTPATLTTRTPGVLTVATGENLSAPWFSGDDAATSDGYEASVARDIAATLGYSAGGLNWVQVDTQQVLDGSTTGFDVLIDRVREPEAGSDVLAFSTGYYSITDALVMQRATFAALAGGVPDLKSLRIGVVGGSSGQTAALERGLTPAIFDSGTAGVSALVSGSIDGLLLPTPDALAVGNISTELSVAGQLTPGHWQPDQFHLVLAKDSLLTPCVSAAVDRLRVEGTLDALTQQWITAPLAPVIG